MTTDADLALFVVSARAIAHDDPGIALSAMLDAVSRAFGVASAAVVTTAPTGLQIAASVGLDERAAAGLSAAIASPAHPIARTFAEPTSTYNVTPVNPGGPALRSHLPLVVTRDGAERVVGVLALAHEDSIEAEDRPVIEAVADLAAVAIERSAS